jgi:hypothetical protein
MTWTYNPATLATVPKDQVRLLIGDTLSTDQQLQDEEILYLLTQRASVYGTAAECCRSLQAKFSRSVDQQSGTNKNSYSQMAKAYGVKAVEFEAKAAATGAGMPYAGGISIADKLTQQLDPDRVPPQFQIGMDENLIAPAAGDTGNESEQPSGA